MKLYTHLLQLLTELDVKHIFGVPGDAINPLVEAIRKQDDIRFIHVAHEEAGAFAASAQAKTTGRLACCAGTVGPGAIHLLNGLYDAKMDHAPVLVIAGQVPTEERGTSFHQEVDLKTLFTDVSVYVEELSNPEQLPRLAMEACHTAIEQRGVAVLVIPHDIGSKEVEAPGQPHPREKPSRLVPDDEILQKAAAQINDVKKVAILAGEGCRNAADDLLKLAHHLNAPLIRTLKAKDIVPYDHPNFVGGLGLLGSRGGVDAMADCELLIMAGSDFPYRDWYNHDIPILQINRSLSVTGRRMPNVWPVHGDCEVVLPWLLEHCEQKQDDTLLKATRNTKEKWDKVLDHQADPNRSKDKIHPQLLARTISDLAKDGALFTCDTGAVTVWGARHLHVRKGQRFTASFNLASMAYAMPAALGLQLAYPDRQVISLSGDGGLNMLLGDLLTAVKYKLPIKVVVFNNHKLGLIKMEQEVEGYPESETDLHNPDYAKLAEAMGAKGFTIKDPGKLKDTLQEAFDAEGPVIVDVHIQPDELTLPPKITIEQAWGFGLSKIRELLYESFDLDW